MSSAARAAERATRPYHHRTRHPRGPRGVTTLMYAAQQGDVHGVRRILRSQSSSLLERDRTGKTALHYCCTSDSVCSAHAADVLVMAAPDLVESRDEDGFTPLHLAVIAGNMQLVTFLLANGADVAAVDNEKHTVVHWATVCGETAALRAALAAGAPVSTPDVHGGYPLHYAAQMCCGTGNDRDSHLGMQVLQALLDHKDVVVSVADGDKRQPLLWAASAGSAKALLALVRAGAVVEAADKDGLTALHCAASRGHTDCLDTLLTLCGASPDVIDSNGCTALHYAVTLGHADATALLLAHGADPNRQDRKGRSPAHCGCAKGQLETVKLIGAHRAKLWLRNARGDLPLHEAAASGRRELVQWLLGMRPSQVNARNNDGKCPLHMAALNDNADMCKILLDAGAQVNPVLRTSRNVFMTPLDCALQRGFRSTAKFLQLHGGVPASRLAELRNQPSSALNLQIRDDVTLWGDTSSESEKEREDAVRSGKKAYKKKMVHRLDKAKVSLSGSDVEIEGTEKNKVDSAGKPKRRSSDKTRERKSSATPVLSTKRSSSKKMSSSRMEYTNEIIINGKTEINIHQTREIILDKDSVLVDKVTESAVPAENAVPRSASSAKDRRPRSAKFSKGRDRSGRSSAEKEAVKAQSSITSPKTIIQQEKESRPPPLVAQSTNTSEETTETVIENKVIKTMTTSVEDEFLKDADTKRVPDQPSLMSNTSEDVEEHKEFVVEASIHEPPRSHLKNESEEVNSTEKDLGENATDLIKNEEPLEPSTETKDQGDILEKDQQKEVNHDLEKGIAAKKTEENGDAITLKADDGANNISQEVEAKKLAENIKETDTESKTSETKNDVDKTDTKEPDDLQKEDEVVTKAVEETIETDIQQPIKEEQSVAEAEETIPTIQEAQKSDDIFQQEEIKTLNEVDAKEHHDQMLENGVQPSLDANAGQIQNKDESTVESLNLPKIEEGIKINQVEVETQKTGAEQDKGIDKISANEATQDVEEKPEITTESAEEIKTDAAHLVKSDALSSQIHSTEEPTQAIASDAPEQDQIGDKIDKPGDGEMMKKSAKKQKKQVTETADSKNKQKDPDTKKKKQLKIEKKGKKTRGKRDDYSEEEYSSPSEEVSLSTPQTHKSFRVLDEGDVEKRGKTKSRGKKSGRKETRSRSEENKKKDHSKERETFKHSKIPTPLGRPILSKSDRHLDKSHMLEKRALQGVLEARVPSLPNIHQDKGRLKDPPRSESNMSAPLLASPHSDDESMSDVEHEPRNMVARNKKRVKKRPKTRDARSAGSDYESSNLIDSGFEPSPRSTRIPKWRNMSDRGVNMTSVTQNIQSNIRRYHLERKIFQHLLELKRHQIRAGQHNEAVLVKRAIDTYHQSCASTVGAGRYIPEDYTFKSFERFLYGSLRKLQKSDAEYMKGLPEAPTNPLLCTRSTNRCMHATHAYTGVPCAAYLPKMDHHTIPKIGFNNISCKPGTGFLPNINAKKAVTLELSHGADKQVISLPTDRLDQNKRYYVTFTVKGRDPSSSNGEDGPNSNAHMHSKSD